MNSIYRFIQVTSFFLLLNSFVFAEDMQDDDFAFVGRHFVASYYDCDPELLDHVKHLKEALCKAIEGSGASLLNMTVHKFAPHGVTLVALLSESHASIHTYPEHGSCFVDLFTCGTSCSSENFHKVLSEELLAKSSKTMILNRE